MKYMQMGALALAISLFGHTPTYANALTKSEKPSPLTAHGDDDFLVPSDLINCGQRRAEQPIVFSDNTTPDDIKNRWGCGQIGFLRWPIIVYGFDNENLYWIAFRNEAGNVKLNKVVRYAGGNHKDALFSTTGEIIFQRNTFELPQEKHEQIISDWHGFFDSWGMPDGMHTMGMIRRWLYKDKHGRIIRIKEYGGLIVIPPKD